MGKKNTRSHKVSLIAKAFSIISTVYVLVGITLGVFSPFFGASGQDIAFSGFVIAMSGAFALVLVMFLVWLDNLGDDD